MISCDVLIVGAGPAGLSVASELSNDLTSIVVHQDTEIGKPVRTSGGSFLRDMQELNIPNNLYQQINQLDIYSDNEAAHFDVTDDQMVILDITGLYQYLAGLSKNKPCQILTGTKFIDCQKQSSGTYQSIIRTRDGQQQTIASRYIVDASGWHCAALNALGLAKPGMRQGIGTEYEYPIGDYDPDRAILFVGTPVLSGYGWVFPTHYGTLRLGVGVIKPDTNANPKQLMTQLLQSDYLTRLGVPYPKDYEVNSGILPSVAFDPKCVFGNVIRVGDAANCATPIAGEGIRIAIEQGRALGLALSQKTALALTQFERAYAKKYARNYRIGFWLNSRVANYVASDWDKSVRRIQAMNASRFTQLLRSQFHFKRLIRTVYLHLKHKLFK